MRLVVYYNRKGKEAHYTDLKGDYKMFTNLFRMMIDRYNSVAFTHHYIWGFEYKKTIYMAVTTAEIMPYICKLDKASRGAGMALRFCPNEGQKLALMPNAQPICSADYFNAICAESAYNRGEVFEKIVTEHFGQTWVKDNVPFTEDGDIWVDGTPYQIKFQKATFCNEKSLANLSK